MKKLMRLLAAVLALTMLCQLLPFSAFAQSDIAQTLVQRRVSTFSLDEQNDLSSVTFEGGAGTPEDPYQIATAEQLDAMRNDLHASYVLVNDIDLSSYGSWIPIGWTSDPNIYYYDFCGNFDGQNHTIYNLTINYDDFSSFPVDSAPRNLGLFYSFGKYTDPDSDEEIVSGTIKNLNLTDINIYGQLPPNEFSIGGLAGSSVSAANISNCNVSGSINVRCSASATSDYGGTYQIGGLCGSSDYTTVSDCSSSVSITISDSCPNTVSVNCGGIIGWADRFTSFVNCVNYGAMTIPDTYATALSVGGIAAFVEGSIEKCINYGSFYVKNSVYHYSKGSNGYHIGGICGTARSRYSGPVFFDRFTIIDCVNCGSINGETSISGSAAGIFATANRNWDNYDNYINNCFNLASEINFSYTIAGETSYFAHRIASCTDIPRNVYSLNTTLLNGQIPLEPDSYLDGTSLSYTEIVSKIREIFPEFDWKSDSDTPGPEPSKEFTFKRDNLSFLNGRGYFFSFEDRFVHAVNQTILLKPFSESIQNTNYSYRISNEKFNQLIEGLTPATKKYITSNRFAEWGGSCRGMSTVVMLHYSYPDRIKLSNLPSVATDTVYELSSPKENSDVQDLVNYYQLAQYLPTYQLKKAKTRTDSFNNFEETLADLIAALKKQPVLIGMASNDGGHAVVFLEILEELEDYYRISIYDPNYTEPQTLVLFKTPYAMGGDEKGDDYGYMHVMYGDYKYITSYIKADDLKNLDIRSYFGMDDHEYYTNYDISYTSIAPGSDISLSVNNELYFVIKNGQIAEKNSLVNTFYDEGEDTAGASKLNITYPAIQSGDKIELELTPREDISDASILLNDTLLNVSSDGPVKLTYDESARTVDVKADDPTAVSLLMTQNTVNDSWPWHSWAVDTTGTTTLHAELDSEGLHLTGDGLTNAKYATENADTEQTSKGTIDVQPDETGKTSVTIINKNDGDTDDTEVKGEDKAEETTYTVTVNGGTASPAKAKEGETVTITAEKTDTFQNWTVVAGGITLENENLPTTTFTMGKENVVITANYSSGGNITPPSPGEPGQSPSDDGGAGIVLAIGAAATVAAGIGAIALMPVKVEGKVELADHTALPGAKIALLQNGKVVAQTTTDANGKFALKVKRGSYELTAAYTDANGQLMHKTASFKAPAKNLTVTF